MPRVYLDHAATTPLDPRVFETMLPYLREHFGNPSSVHGLGRKARHAVEESRERIAAHLGAEASEIVFTSGGTEADHLAIAGVLDAHERRGFVTGATEHEAILRPAERFLGRGYPVYILAPGADGFVPLEAVESALAEHPVLASFMHANNETGVLSPIAEIACQCHQFGVLLHSDAVQTCGHLPIDVRSLGVDLLSLSGHKLYGPKGIGALFVRSGTPLNAVVTGGAQERRRRGGTENVPGIVGLRAALDLAVAEREARYEHARALRDRLVTGLGQRLGGAFVLNTPIGRVPVAPHVVNIAFPPHEGKPLDGEMLILNLDVEGISVSAGSACTSGAIEPSHVLQAMGLDHATAAAAVRFSIGKDNTEDEIDRTVDALGRIIDRMTRTGAGPRTG